MSGRVVRITERTVVLQCSEYLVPNVNANVMRPSGTPSTKPRETKIFLALTAISVLLSLLLFLEIWSGI